MGKGRRRMIGRSRSVEEEEKEEKEEEKLLNMTN